MALFDLLLPHLSDDPSPPRASGIEITQTLKPAGELPVFPPSYEGAYEIHPRYIDGEKRAVIELDSVGSSANRLEEVYLDLYRAGKYGLPVASTTVTIDGQPHEITSLEAPHRMFDAWVRLSEEADGTKFEDTPLGLELANAKLGALTPLLETSTHDLLLGAWDSHRKGPNGQLRVPRAFTSTVIGLDPEEQAQFAARVDPLNLGDQSEAGKDGKRLSELGLSSIPPQQQVPPAREGRPEKKNVGHRGGVSVSEARYQGFLSFAALRKLGFAGSDYEAKAPEVRTLLTALALYGVALRSAAGFELRARASLIPSGPLTVGLLGSDGSSQPLKLDVTTAAALFEEAKQRVPVADRKVKLDAGNTLNDLVAKSLASTKAKG